MHTLRQLLAQDRLLCLPGIYDFISLKIAEAAGFDALYMTGYGTVASHLGLPDAGLATYSDMLSRVQGFCAATRLPVICDGDTGYGGLLNVAHTVRGYDRAGAAAIQLEDQEFPKKCGHTPGRRVIAAEDMAAKVRVAAESRDPASGVMIIARTDARTSLGLDEALRRAELYLRAGADILFVESPETEEELARIAQTFKGTPLLVNNVEGGRTPILPPATLQQMGFRVAIYPGLGFLSAGHALREAYGNLLASSRGQNTGVHTANTPLYNFNDFSLLMGFQQVWDFDKRQAGLPPVK
ncbi:MAG: carboxyvinyl-carboxyphosphonate phosphorylmutase [Betaproteobacteria bacterium]|jgi:2-methylisocitrate lyase-like PEP mutase family enzyme|nr:carboxyvinyl-carboxyphosphonate phosphorylmutase [Betaproteobacteria bacterium]